MLPPGPQCVHHSSGQDGRSVRGGTGALLDLDLNAFPRITLRLSPPPHAGTIMRGKLHLIDLAGSERLSKTGAQVRSVNQEV